jgi:outer membrane protein assembly factor BamB
MMKTTILGPVAACLSVVLSLTAAKADWPQWRGATRDDSNAEKGLLTSWPKAGPKQAWLYDKAGLGYSGFSVVGGKLFTMGVADGKERVFALDAKTGKEAWSAPLGDVYPNDWGDGPRSTPTVDGDRVYALTGQGVLACLNAADGKVKWKVDFQKDFGGKLQSWGYTESALVDGPHVFCTPGGSGGTMAALDKMTGKVVWRSTDLADEAQYASPIMITHKEKKQLVQLVTKRFFALDPATGKVLWEVPFAGRTAVIPTPIYQDGSVYVAAGYGVGCHQVKLLDNGTAEETYRNDVMVNHHGGVILKEGHLFGHSEKKGWTCQNWKTGEAVWTDKGIGKGAIGYADGHFYCLSEDKGTVSLIKASTEKWDEVGQFTLSPQSSIRSKRGRIWTHPVITGGHLYLRDQEYIYCFKVTK